MMKIALTATTGAMGAHLAKSLGHHLPGAIVRIIAPPVQAAKLDGFPGSLEWPVLSRWDDDDLVSALRGCDMVIHASSVAVRNRAEGGYLMCGLTPEAVARLYEAALRADVHRFIFYWEETVEYSSELFRSSAEIWPGAVVLSEPLEMLANSEQAVTTLISRRFSARMAPALTVVVAATALYMEDSNRYRQLEEYLQEGIWKAAHVPPDFPSFGYGRISVSSRFEGLLRAISQGFEGIWELALP